MKLKMSHTLPQNRIEFTDEDFDKFLPDRLRLLSSSQWTPVSVVREVAKILDSHTINEIYDLGSGVGKFSILISILRQTRVIGVEQRVHLLQISENLKDTFVAKQSKFIAGDFLDLDFSKIKAAYCFNPLYETMSTKYNIDDTKQKSATLFLNKLIHLKSKFLEMEMGSIIITYHGFGGIMPKQFQRLNRIQLESGEIEVWKKSA